MLAVAIFTCGGAKALESSPTGPQAEGSVERLALDWFERMRTGKIDRTRLTVEYNNQLTDAAVQEMAEFLKQYEYGAAPLGAQVLLKRSGGQQTFYIVKIVFPRGDAASLMFGFDADGKISGINLMSMAGD
jgi:hypothetical protein